MEQSIMLRPIGHVENDVNEMLAPEKNAGRQSRIMLAGHLCDGLLGIEEYAQVLVVFYFHRADEVRLQLHPRDDASRPLRGVFATRTQYRPNPIGVTVAKLLRVEGCALIVQGLDAMNGTPVLDIKPYAPAFDSGSRADAESAG
jgi:tRNA (adenine37-N6)-methyltransferase